MYHSALPPLLSIDEPTEILPPLSRSSGLFVGTDVVKCTCHLADINDFEEFDKTYREFFTGVKPARTTVQPVLGERIKVEIDAIARVPSGR
jgi:enamine deaminase RidA (YjgF/YER057c/UK114 family)